MAISFIKPLVVSYQFGFITTKISAEDITSLEDQPPIKEAILSTPRGWRHLAAKAIAADHERAFEARKRHKEGTAQLGGFQATAETSILRAARAIAANPSLADVDPIEAIAKAPETHFVTIAKTILEKDSSTLIKQDMRTVRNSESNFVKVAEAVVKPIREAEAVVKPIRGAQDTLKKYTSEQRQNAGSIIKKMHEDSKQLRRIAEATDTLENYTLATVTTAQKIVGGLMIPSTQLAKETAQQVVEDQKNAEAILKPIEDTEAILKAKAILKPIEDAKNIVKSAYSNSSKKVEEAKKLLENLEKAEATLEPLRKAEATLEPLRKAEAIVQDHEKLKNAKAIVEQFNTNPFEQQKANAIIQEFKNAYARMKKFDDANNRIEELKNANIVINKVTELKNKRENLELSDHVRDMALMEEYQYYTNGSYEHAYRIVSQAKQVKAVVKPIREAEAVVKPIREAEAVVKPIREAEAVVKQLAAAKERVKKYITSDAIKTAAQDIVDSYQLAPARQSKQEAETTPFSDLVESFKNKSQREKKRLISKKLGLPRPSGFRGSIKNVWRYLRRLMSFNHNNPTVDTEIRRTTRRNKTLRKTAISAIEKKRDCNETTVNDRLTSMRILHTNLPDKAKICMLNGIMNAPTSKMQFNSLHETMLHNTLHKTTLITDYGNRIQKIRQTISYNTALQQSAISALKTIRKEHLALVSSRLKTINGAHREIARSNLEDIRSEPLQKKVAPAFEDHKQALQLVDSTFRTHQQTVVKIVSSNLNNPLKQQIFNEISNAANCRALFNVLRDIEPLFTDYTKQICEAKAISHNSALQSLAISALDKIRDSHLQKRKARASEDHPLDETFKTHQHIVMKIVNSNLDDLSKKQIFTMIATAPDSKTLFKALHDTTISPLKKIKDEHREKKEVAQTPAGTDSPPACGFFQSNSNNGAMETQQKKVQFTT